MDKRLQFTPIHYQEKLNEYSKGTIEFELLSGLYKIKVNKDGNPTIVELINDYFKIYTSVKPKVSLFTVRPMYSNGRNMFFAKVYLFNDIKIEVFLSKPYKILFLASTIAVFAILLLFIFNNKDLGIIFLIPYLTFVIFTAISKRMYKHFIIHFMNNL